MGRVLKNKERAMADHTPFFDLIGRDVSALLGIAECLEVTGRDRIANLVRSVTLSIEQTVSDLRHDLLHVKRRPKPKTGARRKRKTAILIRRDRSKRASSVKHPPEAPSAVRVRPTRPSN